MKRLQLICEGPFRLFFPLGVLAGLFGVGHWMLWTVGWIQESNAFFHAMIQVQGFLASFVIGFMMTAFPRFLGAPVASLWELALLFGLESAVIGLLIEKQFRAAEIGFLLTLAALIIFVARRFPKRTKSPPQSFLLVGFGLLQAIVGTALMLWSWFGQRSFEAMEAGRQMLQIGFLLSLVLGIGGYLTPFLMGYASDPSCDPSLSAKGTLRFRPLLAHGVAGVLLLGSFFLTGEVSARWGAGLRAGVALLELLVFARIARPLRNKRPYVIFFWISSWMVLLGLVGAALFPDLRIAHLHFLFIGGFSLMIFSFGLMVVISHGAQVELLQSRLVSLKIVGVSVVAAALMRVVADIDAWHNRAWLHASSGLWVVAAGLWLIYVFPKLFRVPPPREPGQKLKYRP